MSLYQHYQQMELLLLRSIVAREMESCLAVVLYRCLMKAYG